MRFRSTIVYKLALLLTFLVAGAAGTAQATHITSFDGFANCEGWTANGTVQFRNWPFPVTYALVDYTVVLSQNGSPVDTHSGQATVLASFPQINLMGAWGDLCGDYTVEGAVVLTTPQYPADDADPRNTATFSAAFTCDCPDEACHFTPGYWKNHASAWPVTSLTLGAITYNQSQLLAILNTPVGGNATIILAYHLIAAKLNVANGASDSIQGAIDSADALLAMYPVGSNLPRPVRAQALLIKDELAAYNEMGCPDEEMPAFKAAGDSGDLQAQEDARSWGELKATYR